MVDVQVPRAVQALRRLSSYDLQRSHGQNIAEMTEPIPIPIPNPKSRSDSAIDGGGISPEITRDSAAFGNSSGSSPSKSPNFSPSSPRLSRNPSFSNSSSYHEDWEAIPPLDKISVFDLLDNFAIPQQLEKLQNTISVQKEKVKRQRDVLKSRSSYAKDRVVEEWRRRLPTTDEQLDRYRGKMREGVDRLGKHWTDTKVITLREKFSFIAGVLNIFISGYLIGGYPEFFHVWYTLQLLYFMPIRYYTYQKRGYHYFLADLCYFVNGLCMLSMWAFPQSKRLFISTYCLAFGNNAIAIAMWRNSLVFHSFDKVTSLFIHIMPCAALHCMVHLINPEQQAQRFPAIYSIRTSAPGTPEHYSLLAMTVWSTVPYAVWQLSYHFFITVRRRAQIAGGRPTSFTWMRKSYSKAWIGRMVLSLPDSLQEPAFMLIQYSYAVLTMIPCPLWFWYRYASAAFLCAVFGWSIYNGATYYIDVFGKRFQNELEQLKKDVQKWQTNPDMISPLLTPRDAGSEPSKQLGEGHGHGRSVSLDKIPPLSEEGASTGLDGGARDVARERRVGDLPA